MTTLTDAGAPEATDTTNAVSEGATLLGGQEGAPQGAQAGQEAGDQQAQKPEVPEVYEFTMPEGVELDAKAVETFTPILRELELGNEQASKLVATFAQFRAAEAQQQLQEHEQQVAEWAKEVRNDPEIGGAKFTETATAAQRAVKQFGSDELRTLLDRTGLGNHPVLVRTFAAIGRAISEDQGTSRSDTDTAPQKSPAAILYPNMN